MLIGETSEFDNTSRVNNSVLAEGGGVEEMVDGFAALDGGEPGGTIGGHDLLHGVDTKVLAHVGMGALAQVAMTTFTVEYGNHIVSFLHILYSFTYTLHYPAHLSIKNSFISHDASTIH